MRVKATINKNAIKKIQDDANEALVKTADTLKNDLQQSRTMPFETGALQNRSTFVDDSKKAQGKVSVVSDTPYARRLYFHPEYNFNQEENPNAGGMWFEPYLTGDKKDFAQKTFAKFMRGRK